MESWNRVAHALLVPTVVERTTRGERSFDLFSRMLQARIVMLSAPIDDQAAALIIAQLLYLDSENPDDEIRLYINSPGGSVTAGLGIYDTMQAINAPVSTVCVGIAASMATVLLAGGARERRYSLPNATIHMHPAAQGMQGYAPDVEIMARELLRKQQLCRELLARDTGQTLEKIAQDFDRDRFLSPAEARAYGLIDAIVGARRCAGIVKYGLP
ncbi:MAG: ATP-dependent Clp protease proteolytic subunit [Oscillochloris sp.]|nr:ATP-dependent Clp protease proteolytic subunit [Oscillochloris sp.]